MSGDRVPPPTKLPSVITTPMSWLYSIGINKKNRDYDAGKGVTKFDRPVISIGNLSTGGTGKTPMVHLVVRALQRTGKKPVIAMRGYGAKPGEKGDEQIEHEFALPGVPVVAQPDRIGGLNHLFAQEAGRDIDCVVLDDGFQHRKIARDLDIVLIDASRPPDRDALLPEGHLRETIQSLSRAGLVVLTHCERVNNAEINRLRAIVSRFATDTPVIEARHEWDSIISYTHTGSGWQEQVLSCNELAPEKVRVVAGIGNTDAFAKQAQTQGMEVSQLTELRDHQALGDKMIERLFQPSNLRRSEPILMTQKDWVKAKNSVAWTKEARVLVPVLRMEIEDRALFEDTLFSPVIWGKTSFPSKR